VREKTRIEAIKGFYKGIPYFKAICPICKKELYFWKGTIIPKCQHILKVEDGYFIFEGISKQEVSSKKPRYIFQTILRKGK